MRPRSYLVVVAPELQGTLEALAAAEGIRPVDMLVRLANEALAERYAAAHIRELEAVRQRGRLRVVGP